MTKSDGSLRTPNPFRTLIMEARHYFAIGCKADAMDSVGKALVIAQQGEEFELASQVYDMINGR